MKEDKREPLNPENVQMAFDENPDIMDNDKLPIQPPLKVLRYKTVKKSPGFGWWSAVVLLEDHGRKQICFYRWKKRGSEWKRDKKIALRSYEEWTAIRDAVESFRDDLES